MIPRYTREEMGHIWSERNEFDTMLLGRNIGIRGAS